MALSVLLVLGGYFLGSIPWGLVVGKVTRGIDIREFGSGKTGATNVLRTLGKGPAIFVIAADTLKGVLAVIAAWRFTGSDAVAASAGLAAVVGHNWPCFAQFRGGRGVLTAGGGLMAIYPPAGLAALATAILSIAVSRFVSLGSLLSTAAGFCGLLAYILSSGRWGLAIYLLVGPLIYVRHHDNIARLLHGTERKLGEAATARE